MKMKLKKCKGFDENPCVICKRKDENAEKLVQSLSIDPDNSRRFCIHFVSKIGK